MVPRAEGTDWEVFAPAKLNLFLEVLGRRSDGFHELETLIIPLDFGDRLRWSQSSPAADTTFPTLRSGNCSFSFDCSPLGTTADTVAAELCSEENLVVRAIRLLAEEARVDPRGNFHLTKRIPLQAGMGGGSSDAAAALQLSNHVWRLNLSDEQLRTIATRLGSDVPFFLEQRAALCRGRGDRTEPLSGLSRIPLVVVKPSVSLATAEVFGRLSSGTLGADSFRPVRSAAELVVNLRSGSLWQACRGLFNRLEEVARQVAPTIFEIKQELIEAGCWGALMTGSGSAVFGVARSAGHGKRVAHRMSAMNWGTVVATSNL